MKSLRWLCFPLAVALLAQNPPADQPLPVVKMTTRMVQIGVIVHDKRSQPVTHLTRDDFVVLDKGKEQPLRYFSMETDRTPVNAATPGLLCRRAPSPTAGPRPEASRCRGRSRRSCWTL